MEQYYLIPKELMDKLMGDLVSFAYLTNYYDELKPISDGLTSCPIIDLSDEAIESDAIDMIKGKWSHLFFKGELGSVRPYPTNFWGEVDLLKRQLTEFKKTLNETK